jgi:hypothetical protein
MASWSNLSEKANAARNGPVMESLRAAKALARTRSPFRQPGLLQEVKHRDRREP